MNTKNIIFWIIQFYDKGFDELYCNQDFIGLINSKEKNIIFLNNILNLEKGKYSLKIEGELPITSRNKWNTYNLQEQKLSYTFENKDVTKTLSFSKIDSNGIGKIIPLEFMASKGAKGYFDNKVIKSNGKIKPLTIESSKEEFNLKPLDEEVVKSLSKDFKEKIKIKDKDMKNLEITPEFINIGDKFFKFYNF